MEWFSREISIVGPINRLEGLPVVRLTPGASHIVWSSGYDLLSFPVEEIDPTPVPDIAFDGKHRVGAAETPVASGQLHPQIHNLSAGVLDNTRSDLQARCRYLSYRMCAQLAVK